jgi:2-polyprenyl-6-methoxyphenol hydroxylase-like FAD-dependent oxidoreductase
VLERRPKPRTIPKAGGLGGQILQLLAYRGLFERFSAACTAPVPPPRFPFGGVHLDFTHLPEPPLHALPLPQPQLERLLDDRARELGAEIRRGHELVAVSQDDDAVTAEVHATDTPYRVTGRFLVGCDGPRSRVRDLAGIPFPGTTYPEVNRIGQVTVPDSVTLLDDGDLDVPGLGRVRAGFTRTDGGVFGLGMPTPGVLFLYTSEDDLGDYDDEPMPLEELRKSIHRVLGADLPLGEPKRLTRFTFHARHAERYLDGRILLAGDAAHLFPATGVGLNAGMLDAVNLAWKLGAVVHEWAPPGLLHTYQSERWLAGERTLLHTRAQVALRRGRDPAADALRDLFQELTGDEQPLRRLGALIAGSDIRYPIPGREPHPMAGTFAPDLTLHSAQGTASVGELMHAARPVLLDLADRAELRETARDWRDRIDVHSASTDHRPADALLIRPDAHIAWAAAVDEPPGTAVRALREALGGWFGSPLGPADTEMERSPAPFHF